MDREMSMLEGFGFQPISLGQRALRTEVACAALVTLAHDRLASECA